MSTKKPPGDETIRGLPGPNAHAEDSFVGHARVSLNELKKSVAEAAPEASQGPWRERAFTPRAVMSRDDVKQGLLSSLRVSLVSANHPRVVFDRLKGPWFPILRQALEQAGGDGMDCWLLTLFQPPGRAPRQAFFAELAEALFRLRAAKELAGFEEEALKLINRVDAALDFSGPLKPRLSFKQMERELEGKIEVDELLAIRSAADEDLVRRLTEIDQTMTQLRDEIRKMPNKQPTGLYSNFVRLKAELRVLDAELKRRAALRSG